MTAREFPVHAFPPDIAAFINAAASTYALPTPYLGASALAVAAGLIGNQAEIVVKRDWHERPIIWVVLIGTPGTKKSPSINMMRKPLDEVQSRYAEAFGRELEDWERLPKGERDPASRPVMRSIFTTDATIEAVGQLLSRSRGLTVISDELASWLSMGRYRSGGSTDRPHWLTLWAGTPLKVDRKTTGIIYVPNPTAIVLGGIQPDLLPTLRAELGRDDGFVDRLFPASAVALPRQWSVAEVDEAIKQRYMRAMLALCPQEAATDSTLVRFGPAAASIWEHWYNENESKNSDGFSAKAPGHVARIALILHAMRHGVASSLPLSDPTMNAAIEMFEYFRGEHARMTASIGSGLGGTQTSPEARLQSRVSRHLAEAGAAGLSMTELHARLGGNTLADNVRLALDWLREEGVAQLNVEPSGGRPRETWSLISNPAERTKEDDESSSDVNRANDRMVF